jgi:hypothetical protein
LACDAPGQSRETNSRIARRSTSRLHARSSALTALLASARRWWGRGSWRVADHPGELGFREGDLAGRQRRRASFSWVRSRRF